MPLPRISRLLLACWALAACDPPPHAEAPPPAGCGPTMVELQARDGHTFCLDQNAVTVAEYQECVGRAQCSVSGQDKGCRRDDLGTQREPINCVDFAQADAFCKSRKKHVPTHEELQAVSFMGATKPVSAYLPEWTSSPAGDRQRLTVYNNPSPRQPIAALPVAENDHRVDLGFRCAR